MNDTLAAQAKAWAEHLATINEMVHSTGAGFSYGENISRRGPSFSPISTESLLQGVINEKQNWHGGVMTQENWSVVGHYTQMVWKDTKEVGCATGITKGGIPPGPVGEMVYNVCRYNPKGNVIGQPPY